ncbi:MAG: alkaline phosphatase family protein [Candidatus Helarchaeota archaeon]
MKVDHVILLIIDDVRYDQFFSLIELGELPNFKKLIKNSIWGKSITTFPSVTMPAHLTIMTGLYQDSYKPPLIHWYDRVNKKIHNYSVGLQAFEVYKNIGSANTIFEKINGQTCNLFEPIHRGTTYNYPGKIKAIGKYLYYKYISDLNKTNSIVTRRILKVFKNPQKFLPNNPNSPPIFTAGWFLATDMILHNYGANSEQYLISLKSVDKAVGDLINGLKELKYLNNTMIMVVSDHGNYSAKELYNPQPDLSRNDLFPLQPKKNKGDYDIADGSVLGFYFSGDGDLHYKTESALRNYKDNIDVIEAVKDLKGIKWLAFRDDKCTFTKGSIVFTKKVNNKWETVFFHYFNDKVRYEPVEIDLLGYEKDEKSSEWLDYNKYYTMNEWLKYSHDLDFPMFPDQIYRNFMNPNSCDIFASSQGEIVYNSVHGKVMKNYHVHAHDIALKTSMQVPLMIFNPMLEQRKIQFSKTADIASTILNMLNIKVPFYFPGIDLVNNRYK